MSMIIISIIIYLVHHLGIAIASVPTSPPYYSIDGIAINCGSSGNTTALDGREWMGDFGAQGKSTSSRAVLHYLSADPIPYLTARISRSQFIYVFHVRPGQKFIRLHFYPSKYIGFQGSRAFFSVKAGPYTLLHNFSPFLTADSLGVKFFAREFCVNVNDNQQALSIAFTPSPRQGTTTSSEDFHAFVNGIEIVSMPTNLYYSRDDDLGTPVIGNNYRFIYIDNKTALEMVYRLNIGGSSILSVEDLGMFRAWPEDRKYLLESGVAASVFTSSMMMFKYVNLPTYIAPLKLYQTAWSMGPKTQDNMMYKYNLTWKLPVNLGFRYLVRLHFCEIESSATEAGQREFSIFINNHIAGTSADVIKWSSGNRVALFKDYMVTMEGDRMDGKRDIIIAMKPNGHPGTKLSNPILNGLEIFKLSNADNNLAVLNPMPIAYALTSWTPNLMKLILAFRIGNLFATSVIVILTLLNIIVYQLNGWGAHSGENNTSSSHEEELCRRFSFLEIQLATKNFDDAFVIGNGGFGKVYRGLIDRGAMTVAIKRLKLESKQGGSEFWMEIETLSTFQHIHLVSLIGYCDERHEMILVYEYMANGTLADHLYETHKKGNGNGSSPLDWEQRLKICIGAARGLDFLHTSRGVRHGLIHRDVKSSNILLDENWVAKISDFGLSKMEVANLSLTHISTAVKGTFGYLDPEYFMTRRLTIKSDVYAFGVVLLEVLCGRPAVDTNLVEEQHSLALWAQSCIKEERVDQIVDTNVKDQISMHCLKEFAKIAYKCLGNHSSERPTMSEVVSGLVFALEQQGRVYSLREAEEISNEQNSKRSPNRGKSITNVDESIAAGEAKGTDLSRMKKYNGSNRGATWGWRWDSLWRRTRPSRATRNFNRQLRLGEAMDEISTVESLQYDLHAIRFATDDFSNLNKLGEGGFGTVHKGRLLNGQDIAVKRLSRNSRQGEFEFKNEVMLLAKLQHRNLVRLLGFCLERTETLLIYEFVPNCSLDSFLFDPLKCEYLDWERRYKIIGGMSRGLLYLHQDSRVRIIHRDLKASNILLDAEMNPKISDFGMASLFGNDETQGNTSRVVGTYGYMAPEYLMHGQFSIKSDVFSFGVLVLEIVSGQRITCFRNGENVEDLLSYAWKNWREGTSINVIDPTLRAGSNPMQDIMRCIHIGLLCVQENEADRPNMASVALMLSSSYATLLLPSKPAYFRHSSIDSSMQMTRVYDSRAITDSRESKSKSTPFYKRGFNHRV